MPSAAARLCAAAAAEEGAGGAAWVAAALLLLPLLPPLTPAPRGGACRGLGACRRAEWRACRRSRCTAAGAASQPPAGAMLKQRY
jgi:hypothetical protein